jgi:hypothetical protein
VPLLYRHGGFFLYLGFGTLHLVLAGLVVFVGLGLVIGVLLRVFGRDFDEPILATPGVGTIYRRFFKPWTYYQVDTAFMFQAALHASVCEVMDGLTTAKGLRALTDEEKKPILREFLRR